LTGSSATQRNTKRKQRLAGKLKPRGMTNYRIDRIWPHRHGKKGTGVWKYSVTIWILCERTSITHMKAFSEEIYTANQRKD